MSSWSVSSLAITAVLATACTPLLGLDGVVGDRDGDGIDNDRDDCPGDYDPQQLDRDGDGLGDACDECGALTVDLDGDGRDDACDGCIGDGPAGADNDGDGIDDGCDACVGGVGTTGSDIDGDGVDDGCDDCIALGVDRDKDGIDDACDACPFGPPHDEDEDLVADACDVCPGDSDPVQKPAELDQLGEACDPDPKRSDVRRAFDGFAFDDPSKWQADGKWKTVQDEMLPPISADLINRQSFIKVRGDFLYRAYVHSTSVTGTVGIFGEANLGIRTERTECNISGLGVVSNEQIPATTQPKLDTTTGIELRLSRTINLATAGVTFSCVAIDGKGTRAEIARPGATADLRIGLAANQATGSYEWVEAFDHPVDQ